jgi:hypothetical protein
MQLVELFFLVFSLSIHEIKSICYQSKPISLTTIPVIEVKVNTLAIKP